MGGCHDFLGFYGGSYEFFAIFSILGLICSILIIVGAAMLRALPREYMMWDSVIIIFSATSFIGMGGFFLSAILSIIGGAFPIIYKP